MSETADQGSPAWLAERLGHCTASRFEDATDILKSGKSSAKRDTYIWDTVAERLTGIPTEHYVNAAMQYGIDTEPLARMAHEAATGLMVHQVGFLHHKDIQWVGCSVDGLIDEDGIAEYKCPQPKAHLTTILTGECTHLPQIQGQLWITGRQWCDFVSFCPYMPEGLRLYRKRIERDDAYIGQLCAGVIAFLGEVQATLDKLKEKMA
jgi:predicted phage-related endonuclease